MAPATNNALGRIQSALRQPPSGPAHMVPFIPAGFGGYETTAATLRAVAEAGASVIEVGIPFSDPIADGPVIQSAYQAALDGGTTVEGIFQCIQEVREQVRVPMLAMVSYSLVFRGGGDRTIIGGVELFCRRARHAGFDGLLCPDLPPPEAQAFCAVAKQHGLEPVLLVAPTTSASRRSEIGQLAGGFIYYLSVAGVTGERVTLPPELVGGVSDMRRRTELPICVGFGIGRAEQVRSLSGVADGAIVGSAYVRRMQEGMPGGSEKVSRLCGQFTHELLGHAVAEGVGSDAGGIGGASSCR